MSNDEQIHIEAEKARQGQTGVGVRYMLVGGFVLVFIVILIFYFTL